VSSAVRDTAGPGVLAFAVSSPVEPVEPVGPVGPVGPTPSLAVAMDQLHEAMQQLELARMRPRAPEDAT